MNSKKVSVFEYECAIEHVYSTCLSLKSIARDSERPAELQRVLRARDGLSSVSLARKNQQLSDRASRAVHLANQVISENTSRGAQ